MSTTVTASNGVQLPTDSLGVTLTYSGAFVATMTTIYSGITYVMTFANNGTNITSISNWVAQAPIPGYMEQESGGDLMITEDGNLMINEAA
jgi:hypothetical protein